MTFISRTAVERELAAGTLAEARVRGPRAVARDLARPRDAAASRPASPTRSSSSPGNAL